MKDVWSIIKSIAIYYNPVKLIRLYKLYRGYISPGSLCFDVGSHVGNRTFIMWLLGAHVVALEPQEVFYRFLKAIFRCQIRVTVLRHAVGAVSGTGILRRSPGNPTLATVSDEWIHTVSQADNFAGIRWTDSEKVVMISLDELVSRYGFPCFIKIDVEGFEDRVLQGLRAPVPALSFEFVPAGIAVALSCLATLEKLACYEYNISIGERLEYHFPSWVDGDRVRVFLTNLPKTGRSGDVYARVRRPL